MLIKDIIQTIEAFAPTVYQESYDNCGLQVGNNLDEATGVLLTLDVTEPVLDEAIARGCNMIVAHHPLIFSGLKRIAGRNYVERIIQKAIKNDITIYAAHTNLDNMAHGVNAKFAEKLGLTNTSILAQRTDTLSKLYAYAPQSAAAKVREAMFAAGGGKIGKYKECSFNTNGNGTFRPNQNANPAIGEAGGDREWVDEVKMELVVEKHAVDAVIKALFDSHPYEEVAYELLSLPNNPNQDIGAGMLGTLPAPLSEPDFLALLKRQMKTGVIRHTALRGKNISKVALCGGSGSFLLKDAIGAEADIFITGDYKYHQFFDAEDKIIIADIGHYESEQFTPEIFEAIIKKKFPTFAVLLSNLNTNPVKYYY
jgi:dinuclear metal center YbgI/SA1388 family protein